jgi:hypothetical protein
MKRYTKPCPMVFVQGVVANQGTIDILLVARSLSWSLLHISTGLFRLPFAPYVPFLSLSLVLLTTRICFRSTARLSDPKNANYFRDWSTSWSH